ncbi:MAG: hypothetical protein ACKVS8_07615 [Phycisphaerales bacterium]
MPNDETAQCMQVKRAAQQAIAELTRGLSRSERDAKVNEMAARFAAAARIVQISLPIGRGPIVGGTDGVSPAAAA